MFAIAILERFHVLPRTNLLLSLGHIALGPFYWQLLGAAASAFLALAYLGTTKLMRHPANYTIGLMSFFLVASALIVWLISSFLTSSDSPPTRRLFIPLFAAIFSFLVGVALSAANLVWVLLRK